MKRSIVVVRPALMFLLCAAIGTLGMAAWQAAAQAGNTGANAAQQTGRGGGRGAAGGGATAGGGRGGGQMANAGSPWPEMLLGGDGAAVLALQRSIEAAVIKGDVAYVDSVTTPDFTFWHGSGWVTASKGTTYDDKAAFLKRVQEKQYLVHDLDNVKVEMHGDLAISFGRYVSLFVPDRNSAGPPPRLTSIWFERVFEKQNGKWMWVSHKTVYGPITSPAGIDPTQLDPEHQGSYVPGMPFVSKAPQTFPAPSAPEAAAVLDLDQELDKCVPAGDWQFFDSVTTDDFQMYHGDGWTRGGTPGLIDDKAAFENRVKTKQYLVLDGDSTQVEMHGDVAITYGRYIATLKGSAERAPKTAWFSVWFERVYQKRNGKWMYVSYKTVHGADYGPSRDVFTSE